MMHRLILCAALVALAGCTGVRPLPAPPDKIYQAAEIPGYTGIRSWGDEVPENPTGQLEEFRRQVLARVEAEGELPNEGRFDTLVLSGGGSDGAFGAGLLAGWSAKGDRPEFGLVTGVSTGALIAPYAFVGPEYDGELENLFTNTGTDQLLDFVIFRALRGESLGLADNRKLKEIVENSLSPRLVRRIAEEHEKGRRLLVGTTNLDAQRPVIWNIGAIAASDHPDARALIRDILLASAAIPGAFAPILFRVEIAGSEFTEMHVDGGVTRQLFSLPLDFGLSGEESAALTDEPPSDRPLRDVIRHGTIYVVRNAKLAPEFGETEPGIVQITRRSVSTLLKFAGRADIEIVARQAEKLGYGLKRTAVPEAFEDDAEEFFDATYMRALYDLGYRMAYEGDPWTTILEPRP